MNLGKSAVVFFFLTACSSLSYRSPGPYYGGSALGGGTYLQEVYVEPVHGEAFRYQSVFQRNDGGVLVSTVTVTGRTAFRVMDPLTPKIPRINVFPSELEPRRAEWIAIYQGFRPLLLLNDKPSKPDPLVRERYPDGRPRVLATSPEMELIIDEYDWEGRAYRLTLSAPEWRARIALREYNQN